MFRVLTSFASLLALSLSFSAAAAPSSATPAKVSANEKVRQAIDDICGDTWCEGDFQFKFSRVIFNKKALTTTVLFTLNPYFDETSVATTEAFDSSLVKKSFDVKCVVKGFADASTILTENNSLNDSFYSAISDCVHSLETQISKGL